MSPTGYVHIASSVELRRYIALQILVALGLLALLFVIGLRAPVNGFWLVGLFWPLPFLASQAAGQQYRKSLAKHHGAKHIAMTRGEAFL